MIEVYFENPEHERTFRRELGRAATGRIARNENGFPTAVSFRPENLFGFEQECHKAGLKDCPDFARMIKRAVAETEARFTFSYQ